jgi:hypothetical protein
MDLFNIEEDSEVDCRYSFIINGKSDSDSNSGPDNKTPSDSGSSLSSSDLGSSNLGLSDSSTSTLAHASKSIKGSHYHSIGTRMLALTRKRDSVPIHLITQELGISKSTLYKVQEKAISRG